MSQALNRIDDALARIEAVAASGRIQSSASDGAEIEALREAHEALRGKVQSAISQLDQLLGPEGSH